MKPISEETEAEALRSRQRYLLVILVVVGILVFFTSRTQGATLW